MIPDRISDKTTVYKHHTFFTHLICVILRIILGVLITHKKINKKYTILLSIFIIIAFSYRNYLNPHSWKNYPRTLISYVLVIVFTLTNRPDDQINIGGLFAIHDAILGEQSRWIANNFAQ